MDASLVREGPVAASGSRSRRATTRADARGMFAAHLERVQRHLTYLVGDPNLAEDLAQETFAKLLEHERSSGDEIREPRAWLLRVASNLAYNHVRSEARRTQRERREQISSALEGTSSADLEDALDVRATLERIEPRDRTVLMLRHTGFTYAEIAEVVGLKESSIGTTLARAQSHFREAYGQPARPDNGERGTEPARPSATEQRM